MDTQELFPLATLLALYERSPRLLYLDYFEDFKELVDWLGPFDIPELKIKEVPDCIGSYTAQEMAKIIGCEPEIIYQLAIERILHEHE